MCKWHRSTEGILKLNLTKVNGSQITHLTWTLRGAHFANKTYFPRR